MKAHRKGWALVLETLITIVGMEAIFIWLLLNTEIGDGIPDALKIWGPISLGFVTVAFLYAHRTPDGGVEYKVW